MTSPVLLANDPMVRANTTPTGVLLVADGSCPQIRELLASAEAPVLWLDGTESPLLAVSRALERQRLQGSSIHTLHWFSHGAPGQLRVGEEWINRASLIANADLLSRWGLRDLALWSCEAGADQDFVALWEELTAATVWSSSELLGRLKDGSSNWTLTSSSATFVPVLPIAQAILQAWSGQLIANYTIANGLGNNWVNDIYESEGTIYAATNGGGLSVSSNNGNNWITYNSTSTGLSNNIVKGVYASGGNIYAATLRGLDVFDGVNWTSYTFGLGFAVNDVYASGKTIYSATDGGLSISTDNGQNWNIRTDGDGLGSNLVYGVYASGDTIYAATSGGLSVSTDGGTTFANTNIGNSQAVYVDGDSIYVATTSGLQVSTDGGGNFENYTKSDGLGSDEVDDVYVSGGTIYAATLGGLSISTDGGSTFTNYTTSEGLESERVDGVYVSDGAVYVATRGGLSIAAPPTLATSTPADDASGVAVGDDLILTFSENVSAGSGDILIKKSSDNSTVATIPVGDPQVTISGSSITINPANDLDAETSYYLEIAPGVIQGGLGTQYAGLTTSTDLNFTTAAAPDTTAPTLDSSTPADNATAVAIGSDVVLTFSEEVSKGTGEIKVKNSGGFTIPSSASIDGDIVTINPTDDLENSTDYYIVIDPDALRDAAGNSFEGISDNSTLNFTTAAAPSSPAPSATASSPALDTSAPGNGVTTSFQGSVITFSLTFADEIQINMPGVFNEPGIRIFEEGEQVGVWFTFQDYTLSDDNKTLEFQALFQAPPPETGDTLTLQLFDDPILDSVSKQPWLKDEISVPIDFDPPTMDSSAPDDDAKGVSIDSEIVLKFSEEVKAGSGSIKIWKNQGDLVEPKLHESIDVSSDQVTIIDNTVTIQPSQDLDYSSLYFIQIGNEALLDQADNYFAGISDIGTLNFTTVAAPAAPAPAATASSDPGPDPAPTPVAETTEEPTYLPVIINNEVEDAVASETPQTFTSVSTAAIAEAVGTDQAYEFNEDVFTAINTDNLPDNYNVPIEVSEGLDFETPARIIFSLSEERQILDTTEATAGGGTVASNAPSDVDLLVNGVYFNSSAGNDDLTGSSFSDFIRAGAGDDIINGGSGNDLIRGGSGSDQITLGEGADIVYYTIDQLDGSTDTITDLGSDDQIRLGDSIQVRSQSTTQLVLEAILPGETREVTVDLLGLDASPGFTPIVI